MSFFRIILRKHYYRVPPSHFKKEIPKRNSVPKHQLSSNFSSVATTVNVDSNNVFSSPFSDVQGFENKFVHEYLWENIDKWPEKTALVCSVSGRSYTYSQLRKTVGRLAMALRKCKLYPGDTITIIMPNLLEFAIILLAAPEAGLCTSMINPMFTKNEMERQLRNSDASAIFTTSSKYKVIEECIENYPNLKIPVVVVDYEGGTVPTGVIKFKDLIREDIEEFSKSEKINVDYTDNVLLPYSSGTSGFPKGVQLTHRICVANLCQTLHKGIAIGLETSESHQEVVPIILPLFHVYAVTVCLYRYLRIGAKMVIVPKYSLIELLKVFENYNPTILYAVPPIIQMMGNSDQVKPHHGKSLRAVVSGAAPLGSESISLFKDRMKSEAVFLQGYGLTETGPALTFGKDTPSESVGNIIPNTQLRIVGYTEDKVNKNLGINELGEIYARGPQIMKGYYKNPEATADCMDGDWFKTGDTGYIDERGLLYISGRIKELIKVKGFQVAPAELEEVIRGFDKIDDVAVIGIPHKEYGEIPKAFVVPKKGVQLAEDELKNFVNTRVAKYKRLGHMEIVDQIPKSPSGKILRRLLQKT